MSVHDIRHAPYVADDAGVGRHWATQLFTAVDFLKRHGHPIQLEELAIRSGVDALTTNAQLLQSFQNHERVLMDDRTGLYSYKVPSLDPSRDHFHKANRSMTQPDFVLKSTADLYSLVRRYAPRGSLSVKTLRESWPQVGPAIEELEREGKVFVTRAGKAAERGDGQMKSVFLNEIGEKCTVDKGENDPVLCLNAIRQLTFSAHRVPRPVAYAQNPDCGRACCRATSGYVRFDLCLDSG